MPRRKDGVREKEILANVCFCECFVGVDSFIRLKAQDVRGKEGRRRNVGCGT